MADAIVSPTDELMAHYANILANFKDRMSLSMAEQLYKLPHGSLQAAIETGKCKAYRCGESRYKVSHQFVGEYVETYCTVQNDPLPS